jgi:hypothetical protein
MNDKILLNKLLAYFYVNANNELHWSLIEDHPVNDEDSELAEALIKIMRDRKIGDVYE